MLPMRVKVFVCTLAVDDSLPSHLHLLLPFSLLHVTLLHLPRLPLSSFVLLRQSLIAPLESNTFFAQFGDPKSHQITLAQAKEYEQAMKAKLEAMAKDEKLADTVRDENYVKE